MNRLSKLILLALALCVLTSLVQEVQIYVLSRRTEPLIRELKGMHPGRDIVPDVVLGVIGGIEENPIAVAVAVSKVWKDLWAFGRAAEIKRELADIAAYYHTLILWRNGALVAASALGVVTIVRRYRTPKAS